MRRLLVYIGLLFPAVGFAQATFTLNDASTYPARRIGINIGAPNYFNSYLQKNLIIVNPSMQSMSVRKVKTASSGSTTGFVSTGDNDNLPANYASGWNFVVLCHNALGSSPGTCSGGAQGLTGTIVDNTANSGGSTNFGITTIASAITANDTIAIFTPESVTTPSGEFDWPHFGWAKSTSGAGAVTIDTPDLPPTLDGFANAVQTVKLNNPGSGDTSHVETYFDTTSGQLNYNFSGTYTLCVNTKLLSGSVTLGLSVSRAGGVNGTGNVTPTGSWTNQCITFTGSETSTTTQNTVVIGGTATGAGSIAIYGWSLTANSDNSSTAYRNQTITNLNYLNPGVLRYNADGLEGSSLTNILTPAQYRKMSSVMGGYDSANPMQQGLHEFLTLAASLTNPVVPTFVIPPTWTTADVTNLVEYLSGDGSTTWGARRIALGQTTPWTTVFPQIIIPEYGNEVWNCGLNNGQTCYPQFTASSTGYWNYAPIVTSICAAIKASPSYSSVIKCGASVQTAPGIGPQQAGYVNTSSSSGQVDRLNVNEYGAFNVTNCGIPNQYTSAFVEPYANTLSGSSSSNIQSVYLGRGTIPLYVYEYNNTTNSGSCTQAQLNGYPEGEGYGLVNTLMPLWAQKSMGITEQAVWQLYQPNTGISTSGGATTIADFGIYTGPGGAFTNPRGTAVAMHAVNGCIGTGNTGIAVTSASVSTFNFAASNGVDAQTNVPYLQSFGFSSGSNRCLVVENIDQSNSYNFTVAGTNSPSGSITRTLYNATTVNSANEGANGTQNVTNVTSTISPGTYSIPAHSIVTLSWTTGPAETIAWMMPQPPLDKGGYQLIPSQQRTFFITQTNYTTVGANFSITGGTIISSANGFVTIQAPSSGSTCGYDTTNNVVTSSTNVVVTATPKDGLTSPVSLTVPVCNPSIQHDNLPAFRLGVYKSQPVNLQCIVIGSMNKTCSWSITTNPGGAGSLADTNQRDTVFTATAPGRYVVTSTAAVNSSTATTIIDVPDNTALPYNVTPNGTVPVNCATDTNLTGTVYQIGPGKTYADFTAFFAAVSPGPGDTIVYQNQGPNGSPTTLANYWVTQAQGTQAQPVFFCGLPNGSGELPVITGNDATSAYAANQFFSGLSLISFYKPGFSTTVADYPKFIQMSGLSLQNANNTLKYFATGNSNTTHNTWAQTPLAGNTGDVVCSSSTCSSFVSAIRVQNGGDLNFIGDETKSTGIGIFTDAKGPISAMSFRLLVEGNNIHDYGYSSSISAGMTGGVHGLYIQTFEELIQGNRVGPAHSTQQGGTYKDRGVVQFTRYNLLDGNDTSSRNVDLVDQEDAEYVSPNMFVNISGGTTTDPGFGWDNLAGWAEAFHDESWFYGNVQRNLTALSPVHFQGDHQQYGYARASTLHYYNNTLDCLTSTTGCQVYDPEDPGGNTTFFPLIDTRNSIVWITGASTSSTNIEFLRGRPGRLSATALVIPVCCNNDQVNGNAPASPPNTGWPLKAASIDATLYADYDNLNGHISGFGASGSSLANAVSTQPFNATTYVTTSGTAGTALPSGYLPVRFQFRPDLGYAVPRGTVVTSATAGIIGGVDSGVTPPPTLVSIELDRPYGTPAPSPVALTYPATYQLAAKGTYSDSSTANITSTCAWSVTSGSTATVGASTGLVTALNASGTTVVNCVLSSVTSNSVTFNVTGGVIPPSPPTSLTGSAVIIGGGTIQ